LYFLGATSHTWLVAVAVIAGVVALLLLAAFLGIMYFKNKPPITVREGKRLSEDPVIFYFKFRMQHAEVT